MKHSLKLENGLFPFLQLDNNKHGHLNSTVQEAHSALNNISNLICLTEIATHKPDKKVIKITKPKALSRPSFLKSTKDYQDTGKFLFHTPNLAIKTEAESPSPIKSYKPINTVPNFRLSKGSPIKYTRTESSVANDQSFEKFLNNSPIGKFKARLIRDKLCDRLTNKLLFTTSRSKATSRDSTCLNLYKFNSNVVSRHHSKQHVLIENSSVNGIVEACESQIKALESKELLTETHTYISKNPFKKSLSEKFPEIDFLKNVMNVKQNNSKNQQKHGNDGVFIKSGKDRHKYISLEKNNIFQMCEYANKINPRQSFTNKGLYLAKFGMTKKEDHTEEKGENKVMKIFRKISTLKIFKNLKESEEFSK
jgi:hypothetical protein